MGTTLVLMDNRIWGGTLVGRGTVSPNMSEELSPVEVADRGVLGANEVGALLLEEGFAVLDGDLLPELLFQGDCVAPPSNHFAHQLSDIVLRTVFASLIELSVEFEGHKSLDSQRVAVMCF